MRVSFVCLHLLFSVSVIGFADLCVCLLQLGEGHFDDGNKPSGTATPVEAAEAKGGSKKKGKGSKKAKTAKQRLAIADGEIDA